MTGINSQIAAIFTPGQCPLGAGSAEDWRRTSVQRDIARFHHLTCGPFTCALPGARSADSRTLCSHVLFIGSGALRVGQWGHTRILGAGDIFVACGWLPMALDAADDLEMLVVELPAWWAVQRFIDRLQILPDLYVGRDFFAAPIIHKMARAVFELPEDDAAASGGLDMMADLLRTALAACVDTSKTMPRALGRMGAILGFVAQRLDQPGLSAQDAAASLKCSVRTIYKTCSSYGTSFNGFLMEIRLVAAEHQLLRANDRVSQIAYSVGFTSLSHFARLFKARFGVPANTYRRMRRPSSRSQPQAAIATKG